MRPLAWRASATPKSSPPKSTAALPPVPNVVSSAPSALSRATWKFPPSGPGEPAEQELAVGEHDHGHCAADRAPAEALPAVAGERGVERAVPVEARDGDAEVGVPDEHDLAVRLNAAPKADSSSPPNVILRFPPDPNVVSRLPFVRRRATQKELAGRPAAGTTILPLRCTSTARAASVPPKLIFFLQLPAKSRRGHPRPCGDATRRRGRGDSPTTRRRAISTAPTACRA